MSNMHKIDLTGCGTALITPFKNGEVDYDAFAALGYPADQVTDWQKYNTDDITLNYEGKKEINFKDKKGDKLGVVKLYYQDQEVNSIDVYLEDEIKFNLFNHILQSKIRISLISIIFIGLIILIIKKGAKF